jgi:hypothetical protein
MAFCTLTLIGLLAALPPKSGDATRLEEVKKLIREYEPLEAKHFETPIPDKPTTAQLGRWCPYRGTSGRWLIA